MTLAHVHVREPGSAHLVREPGRLSSCVSTTHGQRPKSIRLSSRGRYQWGRQAGRRLRGDQQVRMAGKSDRPTLVRDGPRRTRLLLPQPDHRTDRAAPDGGDRDRLRERRAHGEPWGRDRGLRERPGSVAEIPKAVSSETAAETAVPAYAPVSRRVSPVFLGLLAGTRPPPANHP